MDVGRLCRESERTVALWHTVLVTDPKRDSLDLEGRVAVVTGASRGIGFAIAEALVSRGCSVVITARHLLTGLVS